MQFLTCNREPPKIHDIGQPSKDSQPCHPKTAEEHLVSRRLVSQAFFPRSFGLDQSPQLGITAKRFVTCLVKRSQIFKSQLGYLAVHFGHRLDRSDRRGISTLINQKLWRLVEFEDEESDEEDDNGDGPECKQQIPPTHIARSSATFDIVR